MPYQPIYRNQLAANPTYSAFSRSPQSEGSTYSIHLVKADDPAYIPGDFEVWPIYSQAIIEVLREHPAILDAAVEAVKKASEQLRGLQNRDIPPGTRPSPNRPRTK